MNKHSSQNIKDTRGNTPRSITTKEIEELIDAKIALDGRGLSDDARGNYEALIRQELQEAAIAVFDNGKLHVHKVAAVIWQEEMRQFDVFEWVDEDSCVLVCF